MKSEPLLPFYEQLEGISSSPPPIILTTQLWFRTHHMLAEYPHIKTDLFFKSSFELCSKCFCFKLQFNLGKMEPCLRSMYETKHLEQIFGILSYLTISELEYTKFRFKASASSISSTNCLELREFRSDSLKYPDHA